MVEELGPAVLGAPYAGAVADGDDLYLVTRGLRPARVARLDLGGGTGGRVVADVALPSGSGGWGAATLGDRVYAGTYGTADVLGWSPATGEVTAVARLAGERFVWTLAVAPDGALWAGTHPGGKVYRIDVATGRVDDLGQVVPDRQYVRVLAFAPDGSLYAGVGAPVRLVELSPATGEVERELLAAELAAESFVMAMTVAGDRLVLGTEGCGLLAIVDRHAPERYAIVRTGRTTVDTVLVHEGEVWFTTRPDGALHRTPLDFGDVDGGLATRVAVPIPGAETRALTVHAGAIVGVTGDGRSWRYDPATGTTAVTDLLTAGLPSGPDSMQSVARRGDGSLLTGGNLCLCRHDPAAGTIERIRLPGEAKASVTVGDTTYLAVYPGAYLDAYDGREVRRLSEIGPGQNRPLVLRHLPSRSLLLVGTRAAYGYPGGLLAVYDLERQGFVRRLDPLPGQAIRAIAVAESGADDPDVVWVGGDTVPDGAAPVVDAAGLAAVDLRTGEVRDRWTPLPDAAVLSDVAVVAGGLVLLTGDGVVRTADPATRRTGPSHRVDGDGRLVRTAGGGLHAVTRDAVYRLDADATPHVVVDGLAGDWFGYVQPAYDPATGDLYVLRDRTLVRVPL